MSGSLRSLSKCLETFFNQPSTLDANGNIAIPQETTDTILQYVEEHRPTVESTANKLHEELIRLHKTSSNDVNFEIKFLGCLSLLLPCLITIDIHKYWFGYYSNPALNSAGQPNALVKASRDFILSVMLQDDEVLAYKEIATIYCRWILEIHLGTSGWLEHISQNGIQNQERRRFIRMNGRDLLIQFGQKKTTLLLTVLNEKLVQKDSRVESLALLSVFVSQQPPYLFQIKNTPLLDSLYNCLLNDVSATALTICANTLAMILPHICNTLSEKLPMLFAIYGRLACWHLFEDDEPYGEDDGDVNEREAENLQQDDQESNSGSHPAEKELVESNEGHDEGKWEKLGHYFNLEEDDRRPSITPLFTFLYGLFPANLISFLKKPTKYLTKANYELPFDDFWDEYEIMVVSKPVFELHVLNPGLISNTVEDETNDPNRWSLLGSAADIAALCLGYYNQGAGVSSEHRPPEFKLPFSETPSVSGGKDVLSDDEIDPKSSFDKSYQPSRSYDILDKSVVSDFTVYNALGTNDNRFSDYEEVHKRQIVAPGTEAMDDLLIQHSHLYTKSSGAGHSSASGPQILHRHSIATIAEQVPTEKNEGEANSSDAPTSRGFGPNMRTRSGTLSSPGFFPISSSKSPNNSQVSTPGVAPLADPETTATSNHTSPRTSTNAAHQPALTIDTAFHTNSNSRSSSITTAGIEKPSDGSYEDMRSIVAFYQRELLLLKNELDFVSFIEQHSQYRFKKMREQLSRKVVNDESVRHLVTVNSDLRKRLDKTRAELSQSQRNTKTYRKERQKYENEIIKKSKEFRQSAIDLKQEKDELQTLVEGIKTEKETLKQKMVLQEAKISNLELKLTEANSQAELVECYKQKVKNGEEEISKLQRELDETDTGGLKTVDDVTISDLQKEIDTLRLENDGLELEKEQQEKRYQNIINDLNKEVATQEARPHRVQNNIMDIIEKHKKHSEEQFGQLQSAYDELARRHTDLKVAYRNHILAEEERKGRILSGDIAQDAVTHTVQHEPQPSLLGFDAAEHTNGEPSPNGGNRNTRLPSGSSGTSHFSRKHGARGRSAVRTGNEGSGTSSSTSRSKSRASSTYRGMRI